MCHPYAPVGRVCLAPIREPGYSRSARTRQAKYESYISSTGHFLAGMGDHAWQHKTYANRQHSDGHEDILQGSNQWRLLLANPTAFKSGPTFETVLTPAIEYGAGWVVKLNRKVALRFDLRDYLTSAKRVRATAELTTGEKAELKIFGGAVQNVVPTLGIVFIF